MLDQLAKLGLAAAGVVALSTSPQAETYVASTYLNPTTPLGKGGYVLWPEAVEKASNGEITFQVHHSASLLPFRAHLQGIADGVAQVGQIAGTYTPSMIPLQQVLADLAFANPDPFVIAFASTEMNMTNPRLLEEWSRNNVVYGGGYSTPPYMLICRDIVETLDDIRGKKVRTPGSAWDRVITDLGAVPINVPSSEMFTGLDSGNLDCAANGADTLKTFSLWDVSESLNTIKLGLYFSGWLWGYNQDFWAGLRPDQRRLLFDEMAAHIVKTEILYHELEREAIDEAPAHGVQVIGPPDELQAAVDAFAEQDLAAVEAAARETHKVENPHDLIDEFNQLVGKWTELLDGVPRTDEATMTALVKSEIYNKIDETTYGLN